MKQNVKKFSRNKDDFMRCRYSYTKHQYEWVRVPLILYREYWTIWIKNGRKKLKKTLYAPKRKKDQYGWSMVTCYEVVTCVKLKRYEVIYLKGT